MKRKILYIVSVVYITLFYITSYSTTYNYKGVYNKERYLFWMKLNDQILLGERLPQEPLFHFYQVILIGFLLLLTRLIYLDYIKKES